MLKSVKIDNFKSFATVNKIDFSVSEEKGILSSNYNKNCIFKGAMFIGANASGKSNALKAIVLLLDLMFLDADANRLFKRCYFSDKCICEIEYVFDIQGHEVKYEIGYNFYTSAISELLIVDNLKLLARDGKKATLYGADGKQSEYREDRVGDTVLFFRTLFFNALFADNSILQEWMKFLRNSIYIDMLGKKKSSYGKNDLELGKYLSKYGLDEVNAFFKIFNFDYLVEYEHKSVGKYVEITYGKDENQKNIFFKRKSIDAPIPYMEESMGNQALLQILPYFFYIVKNSGMLLVDEFSSGFHNSLEKLLVKYFMDNAKDSQLMLVTHSTNLLNNAIMNSQQGYIVEFNGKEGSKVSRLPYVRAHQNIERMYMNGVFGGLPLYGVDDED